MDLRNLDITGSKIEKICDMCDITVNKNTVPGDQSAISPGGVRLGTCALTTRGFVEEDFVKVGEILDRIVKLAINIQKESGKKLQNFIECAKKSEEILKIKRQVNSYANNYFFPY